MRPTRPVTFEAAANGGLHDFALRIAMVDDDDLMLRFQLDIAAATPAVFT
jgi:hypothetical protein